LLTNFFWAGFRRGGRACLDLTPPPPDKKKMEMYMRTPGEKGARASFGGSKHGEIGRGGEHQKKGKKGCGGPGG